MDSLPYGGRGQRRSGLSPSSTPSFRRLSRRRLSFLLPPARSSSLSKHHKDFPLACGDHKHNVCRHAHVPNSHSLPAHERERGRGIYHPHLMEEDARALNTYTTCTRTYARVRSRERSPRALTCAPFCRAFSGPAFQNCPHDGSTDKCSFFVRDTRVSDLGIPSGLAEIRRD